MAGAPRNVVTIAFVFPLAFAIAFVGLFAIHADARAFSDTVSSLSVIALALCGAVATSVLAGFGVAKPAAFATAVLSWVVADVALRFALRDAAMTLVMSAATPADGERAFVTSAAAALAARDVGALASASIAFGLALSFLVRARRDGLVDVIAPAALAFALTALALPAHGSSHHVRHALAIFAGDAAQGRAALVDAVAHAAEAARGFHVMALAAVAVALVALPVLASKRNWRAVVDALACAVVVALAFVVDRNLAAAPIATMCETIAPAAPITATPVDAPASTRDNAP